MAEVLDWCLITDIDGTLLGESDSTKALRRAVSNEREALARHGQRLYWVLATGRPVESAREALVDEGFSLDEFDAWVTSVGAEVYLAGETSRSEAYTSHLLASGFERRAVLECLRPLEFLKLQPEPEQLDYKVSYFAADTPENRARIHAALSHLAFATRTVFSHDEYLDIAPSRGAKGGAVNHLLDLWRIARHRAVAAGDSGNDETLLEQDFHGIVVGNGRLALAHLSQRPNVYFATRKHAGGVLEGLVALGFLREGG